MEAGAAWVERGARAATAGWAQAEVWKEWAEASGAAEVQAGVDAGRAEERVLRNGAARRLRGKAEG